MSFSGTKGYLTKPKPGIQINPSHPLSRGLVGYWLFNEGSGSLANDISGCGNHGRLINMSPNIQSSGWNGSKFGGGLHFDGVDDYVENNMDASLNFGNGNFSCSVRIKGIPPVIDGGFVISKYDNQISSARWSIELRSTGYINAHMRDANGNQMQASGAISIDDDRWHHIVVQRIGDTIYLYIDRILDNFGTNALVGSTDIAAPLRIGTISITDVSTFHFNGSIDEVRIYNRALSTAEIEQLYYDPFCNLLQIPMRRYSVITPAGAIMNQFQRANIGADLYNGVFT